MDSPVSIARMALTHIGARTNLESLDERTPEASAINAWFSPSRRQTLEGFNWSFARKRIVLALHGEAAPGGVWGFRYQYPTDALVIRRVFVTEASGGSTGIAIHDIPTGLDATPYDVETASDGTRSIVTNLEQASALYTFDQTDFSAWSALAIEALSHLIASRVAFTLTKKPTLAAEQFQLFLATMQMAQGRDANQRVSGQERDADWIRRR